MPTAPTTVFLDRDGVISRGLPAGEYVVSVDKFDLLPGSPEAIARLTAAGATVFVVTNQQGVGKGLMSLEDLDAIHAVLLAETEKAGGSIAGILVCPHLEGTCDCRKPATGLFLEAQRRLPSIVLSESIVVGDSESDMEAARRIGAKGIMVGTSRGAEHENLSEAVDFLLGQP